jgi:hypothetical protein
VTPAALSNLVTLRIIQNMKGITYHKLAYPTTTADGEREIISDWVIDASPDGTVGEVPIPETSVRGTFALNMNETPGTCASWPIYDEVGRHLCFRQLLQFKRQGENVWHNFARCEWEANSYAYGPVPICIGGASTPSGAFTQFTGSSATTIYSAAAFPFQSYQGSPYFYP